MIYSSRDISRFITRGIKLYYALKISLDYPISLDYIPLKDIKYYESNDSRFKLKIISRSECTFSCVTGLIRNWYSVFIAQLHASMYVNNVVTFPVYDSRADKALPRATCLTIHPPATLLNQLRNPLVLITYTIGVTIA